MLDLREPSRIRIISNREDGTAFVTDDITLSKPDEKLTLQAALGMKGRQSYLVAQKNLVVEGVDDFIIITELSNLLLRSGIDGLPEDVYVTAAGGASEAVYIATFMIGQELEVVALFDSDAPGRTAEVKLTKKWLTRYKNAKASTVMLGKAVGQSADSDFAIEDMFPEDFYLEKVMEVYGNQLKTHGIKRLKLKGSGLLCDRVNRAMEESGIDKFNKGSVAKRIKTALVQMKSAEELPDGTKEKAANLIKSIIDAFPKSS
jgi:hypothetical protein